MKIFIDDDYKCYVNASNGLSAVETTMFDGKCKSFIEGCRFIPEGCEWTREDGEVFKGASVFPWKDSQLLEAAQAAYEESLAELTASYNEGVNSI